MSAKLSKTKGYAIMFGEAPAKSMDDVQEYMALWHVHYNSRKEWHWNEDSPIRSSNQGDNAIWVAWRDREEAAGRVRVEHGVKTGPNHAFTDKWFEEAAPLIMKYRLLEAK